jgi:hypothetical protein
MSQCTPIITALKGEKVKYNFLSLKNELNFKIYFYHKECGRNFSAELLNLDHEGQSDL